MAMSPATTLDSLYYYLTDYSVADRPSEWALSLHDGPPGSDGSDNELSYSGYAREALAFEDGDAPLTLVNDADVEFAVTPAEVTVTHIVVWGSGTPLVIQALAEPKVVAASEAPLLAAAELTIGGTP